jgi:hypothetical protein
MKLLLTAELGTISTKNSSATKLKNRNARNSIKKNTTT